MLAAHPRLRLCVPHLGCADYHAYAGLLKRHDNLWVDTAMILAGYLPDDGSAPDAVRHLLAVRPDRVMYGTDFPIIPYAWDRELRRLAGAGLPPDALVRLLAGNAERFYG